MGVNIASTIRVCPHRRNKKLHVVEVETVEIYREKASFGKPSTAEEWVTQNHVYSLHEDIENQALQDLY
jgi:hypothetical protein